MFTLASHPPRLQPALASTPYDRWVTPEGEVKAEFHRLPQGVLVRFPDEADFAINLAQGRVEGWPAPQTTPHHFESLYAHGVVPLIGNHLGGLFLHGSAVAIDGVAVAFIGLSRSGKTTLAGALAKNGYPLLTEDVIELSPASSRYLLSPKPSRLRLFADSAAYLLGHDVLAEDADDKQSLDGGAALPFCTEPAPLARIFVLGTDAAAGLAIAPLDRSAALAALLPHAFVLDVEDRARLRAHFHRIAELAERVACRALDYPRRYEELPRVMRAIVQDVGQHRDC